jgi:hypothetical protein
VAGTVWDHGGGGPGRSPEVAFAEIFRFERAEMTLRRYGSNGIHATRIAASDGQINLTCLNIGPDGLLGTHPASAAQRCAQPVRARNS